jgi:hypothetical protein
MRRSILLGLLVLLLVSLGLKSSPARAAVGPVYNVKATWGATNLTPGDKKTGTAEGQFMVQVRNVGDAAGSKDLSIEDMLPAGVTIVAIHWPGATELSSQCSGKGTEKVKCTLSGSQLSSLAPAPGPGFEGESTGGSPEPSGYLPAIYLDVSVPSGAKGEGTNTAIAYGGSAALPGGLPCAQVEADLTGLPPCGEDVDQVTFSKTPSPFGLVPGSFLADMFDSAFPAGKPSRQAGAHPFEFRFNFDITARTGVNAPPPSSDGTRYITSSGQVRTVEATLPRGTIGNPEAMPKCDPTVFAETGVVRAATACPPDTQVGYLDVYSNDGNLKFGEGHLGRGRVNRVAIYNLVPPKGTPVDFGFNVGNVIQGHVYATLDPSQNYAIKSVTPNITSIVQARGAEVTLWGVPADPAHDKFRYFSDPTHKKPALGAPWGSAPIRPFFTLPMDCGFENGGARVSIDSYNHPGQFSPVEESGNRLDVEGCGDPRFHFEPKIAIKPTDLHAGAPTGLDVHLEVPQQDDEAKEASELYVPNEENTPTPPIKKAVVRFPEGMTLSPSAAQGLQSCSAAQIDLGTDSPVECPDASQFGTLTLHTPILPPDAQPKGWIYVAKQGENPFHNFLSLYLVVAEPERGILVKVPGRVDLNPDTGQVTASFDDLPQFPLSDMQMTFKEGERAGLVEPITCGAKTISAEFFSWQSPETPQLVKSSYEVTENPDGSRCVDNAAQRPFRPKLAAGTLTNTAGKYSPLFARLTRSDADQEFSRLSLQLPQGLVGKVGGVGRCDEASIARAESRVAAGDGALEQREPSCPGSALIGTVNAGAGVGAPLTYVPGKIYLAGPYRGAPISVVVITPAVVGPFDLGVVTVRAAVQVDPETAQVSTLSEPFPQIFQGVPVRLRDVRLNLDRREFTLNPTSCAEKHIDAHITGVGEGLATAIDDAVADISTRFQAAGCAALGFKPKLSFRLFGGTHRGSHPKLVAKLEGRPGDANIAGTTVTLPHSEFLDQGHIKTICTRVQFAADKCPKGAIYGHVTARTPLFDEAFTGPLYLRSSSHELPDLVAVLRGPASLPIEVDLGGRIDSVHGGIRTRFEVVPDVPVSSFSLTMQGDKKGLLINSVNLCKSTHRAVAKFKAQSGKRLALRPVMRIPCKGRSPRGQ